MDDKKKILWDVFTETGDIEVYLRYKEQERAQRTKGSGGEVEACGNDGADNQRG